MLETLQPPTNQIPLEEGGFTHGTAPPKLQAAAGTIGLSETLEAVAPTYGETVQGGSPAELSEITRRQGEFVKEAPKFREQVNDVTRTNPIEYVHGMRRARGTNNDILDTTTLTEQESIAGLHSFLEEMTHYKGNQGDREDFFARQAKSMLENMTFIGKREYDEATRGISDKWTEYLRSNPTAQICAVVGRISSDMVKSDSYLLDNIIKNFTDEQLDEFSGRIVLDPKDLTVDPENVRIVMLDDWTISASQLTGASITILDQYPQYKDHVEIQLITATKQRINDGLNVRTYHGNVDVPINAYFAAHTAPSKLAYNSGAHITGAHCDVDHDFSVIIEGMAAQTGTDMPPLTNIVRPYRKPGTKLTQIARLRGLPEQPAKVEEVKHRPPKQTVIY